MISRAAVFMRQLVDNSNSFKVPTSPRDCSHARLGTQLVVDVAKVRQLDEGVLWTPCLRGIDQHTMASESYCRSQGRLRGCALRG